MDPLFRRLCEWIASARRIVAFTGAGISTESGISDYRSKGGLWERYQPVTIQDYLGWDEKRIQFWAYKSEFMEQVLKAEPNGAHRALVELEHRGQLLGVVTQNIDGLHQRAGTSRDKIVEIHGSNMETVCLKCGDFKPWEKVRSELRSGVKIPHCSVCGGLIKPNIVMFGEELVPEVLDQASDWIQNCDLLLVIGSTLLVQPAASLPWLAKEAGAKVVILNMSDTPMDGAADLKIFGKAGEILETVMQNSRG